MNRIVYMVIKNCFRAPRWFYNLFKFAREDDDHTEQERFDYIKNMVKTINRTGNVSIEVHGVENLPEENGFVMFPNHQGLYDSLALIQASPKPFGIVIKKRLITLFLLNKSLM